MPEQHIELDERVDRVYRFGIPLVIQPPATHNDLDTLVSELAADTEDLQERQISGLELSPEFARMLHREVIETGRAIRHGAEPSTALHALIQARKPGIGDNDPPPPGSGSMDSLELVRRLHAAGADLDARMTRQVNFSNTRLNKLGATPLFLASMTADADLVRLLAELGADPAIPNDDNSTPLHAAAGLGTRSPGEDAGSEEEVLETVDLLLSLGLDIDAVDDDGETPMHGAAYKNLPAVVEQLAAKGADIAVWNKENAHGWTPLTIARGYRFGNFKPSAVTVEALSKVMTAAGVPIPPDQGNLTKEIY